MKKISAVMVMAFFLFTTIFSAQAQGLINAGIQVKSIEPYPLAITCFKTTNIIFPYAIISVDRGSKDVLVQKAKGVQNVLQLKAAKQNFLQTNLTVITADGKLNSFLIGYAEQPSVLNLSLITEQKKSSVPILSKAVNQAEVEEYAKLASASKEKVRGGRDKRFGVCLKLNGLFIHNDVMYLRISIQNKTNINYDIDQLRFYIKDQKRLKRTATQELEIKPLYKYNDTATVAGQSEQVIVFAFPKFTIPDQKYLSIQLMEKSGGRHLQLKVHNRTIIKAKTLK